MVIIEYYIDSRSPVCGPHDVDQPLHGVSPLQTSQDSPACPQLQPSSQTYSENKATHSILLLVSCFVFFYCSNKFVTLYGIFIHEKIPRLEVITGILSSCYPTICPFFLKKNKIVFLLTSFLSMLRFICSQWAFSGWSDTQQFLSNRRVW
jgi:hypothetical protein